MAKLVFGLNQSLDGYVDHQEFAPGPSLFRHFTEQVRDLAGSVYGRRMYEVMRYWDEDRPEWDAEECDFAAAWRSQPKWVVSRSLKSVGPNATLVADDVEAVIRGLKAQLIGEIEVGGPDLARSLTDLGLIDEYRLYFRPVVLTDPIVIESSDDFKSTPQWRDRLKPYRHQVSNLITFCRRLPVTLLADDVGLGKTISAGLVMSKLIVRSRLSKTLIVCPKLLGPQWKQELEEKFDISSEIAIGRELLTADPGEVESRDHDLQHGTSLSRPAAR